MMTKRKRCSPLARCLRVTTESASETTEVPTMKSANGSPAIWPSTLRTLRQDFHQAAAEFPTLRHAIVQALDEEGTIPPSLEREMRKAGGWSEGELRGRWGDLAETAKDPSKSSHLELLQLNAPAKRSYLFGEATGRATFERLAERAWLALPGSTDGKAHAYPQPRIVERWLAFVYERLQHACVQSSYLSVEEDLVVCDYSKSGRRVERHFALREVNDEGVGYPDAVGLSRRARRWIYTALATDPFTVSTVAIDVLLADPRYVVSWNVMDSFLKSPAFQESNYRVDYILLGENRTFPIYRNWCVPVPGSSPSLCPNADPPADEADRKVLLALLPDIEKRFRSLRLIGKGQTIHWVGRQERLGTVCMCFRNGVKDTGSPAKPVWNKEMRELSWDGVLVRKYKKHPAHNQVRVLDAFQAAGWAATIENPFHVPKNLDVTNFTIELKKLNDTVRSLNNGMAKKLIRFESNGANRCQWRPV
jgi:hypothetical protein